MSKNQPPSKDKRVNQIGDLDWDTPAGGNGTGLNTSSKSKKGDLMDGNQSDEEE